MFKFIKRRKMQQLTQRAVVDWVSDLDSLIVLIEYDLAQIRKDLEDLTDFVEDNLD